MSVSISSVLHPCVSVLPQKVVCADTVGICLLICVLSVCMCDSQAKKEGVDADTAHVYASISDHMTHCRAGCWNDERGSEGD